MKKFNHFFLLLIISALIIFVWYKTLNQTLWGDGFYFFNPLFRFGHLLLPVNPWTYNIAARIIYEIFIPIFKDQMAPYFLLQIVFLIIMTLLIYAIAYALTENKLISFITSIIFSTNSGAIYEMMAEGNFNRFVDRVPNLI